MTPRRGILAVACVVALAAIVLGGLVYVNMRFEAGGLALKMGDYASAKQKLAPLARLGHHHAQHILGQMYAFGWGVPKNDDEAIRWFRRAEMCSDGTTDPAACAAFYVGRDYDQGFGVERDPEEAERWYRRSAAGGYAKAKEWVDDHELLPPERR